MLLKSAVSLHIGLAFHVNCLFKNAKVISNTLPSKWKVSKIKVLITTSMFYIPL